MNDIAIVAVTRKYGEIIKNDLLKYFKEFDIDINIYTADEINKLDMLHEKCIFVVNIDIFEKVKLKTKENSEIVINRLTFKGKSE